MLDKYKIYTQHLLGHVGLKKGFYSNDKNGNKEEAKIP